MKLQLDTEANTIKIEGSVNLGELFDYLNQILPNGLWKKFSLIENEKIIDWVDPIQIQPIIWPVIHPTQPPIIIDPTPYWPLPYVGDPPPSMPWITYTADNMTCELKVGTYNIEI